MQTAKKDFFSHNFKFISHNSLCGRNKIG